MTPILVAILLAPCLGEDATFAVHSASNEPRTGKLVQLTSDLTATIVSPEGRIQVKDVTSIRHETPIPPFPIKRHLITAYGDRIVGEMTGGNGRSLQFIPSGLRRDEDVEWSIPLSAIVAIWATEPPADTPIDPARYSWVAGTRNRDVVRYRNGDTTRGTLTGFDAKARHPRIRFRPELGEVKTIAMEELDAIAFNPALIRTRKADAAWARVVLKDGSRLNLELAAIQDGNVTGVTMFGRKVAISLRVVVALDVVQGKATYISDLKPEKTEQNGFLTRSKSSWSADRDGDGTAIAILEKGGVSTHDKGLGTSPRTVLSYDLAGKYRRFEALVGINPRSGTRGAAKVRVLVDGRPHLIGDADGLLSAGKAVPVRLDIRKAKRLAIEVDFGPAGGVEADVNWADARLIE